MKILRNIIVIIIGLLLTLISSVAFMYYKDNNGKKTQNDELIAFEVKKGESVESIANRLKKDNVIKYPVLFKLYGKISKKNMNIKFGFHPIKSNMTYDDIYNSISSSEMSVDVYNKVTIPEGYTVKQIANKLSKEGVVDESKFLEVAEKGEFDYWFLDGIPTREGVYKLEGFLYPQTYYLEKNISEKEIIEKFLDEFDRNVSKYKDTLNSSKFYDIIKIASIVERETFIEREKDVVAGVFYNRLKQGIKLESCATVEYVLNTRKKVLSAEDISIDSPYNTYKVEGLPPTPISNPSINSIEAAANPKETKYMFFVANKDGSGHIFASTYEEHLKNIERYR